MLYYDPSNETITEGMAVLKAEAEDPAASPDSRAYFGLIKAISIGKGFEFFCEENNHYCLNRRDLANVLKELLYAIETERLTDRWTHKNIVDETLETLLDMYV